MTGSSRHSASVRLTLAIVTLLRWTCVVLCAGALLALPLLYARGDGLTAAALDLHPGVDPASVLPNFVALEVISAAFMALCAMFLKPLEDVLKTVLGGSPFTRGNAGRLRAMGWLILAMQALVAFTGRYFAWLDDLLADVHLNIGPSFGAIVLALLCFVLAQVFDAGGDLAEDVEGTI